MKQKPNLKTIDLNSYDWKLKIILKKLEQQELYNKIIITRLETEIIDVLLISGTHFI